MPPDSKIQTDTPLFTECVSTGGDHSAENDPRRMAARLQELVEQVQTQPNPAARALLEQLLQSLMAFYGEGLRRILEHVNRAEPEGRKVMDRLLADPAIGALLLIHGLHPNDIETRLRSALDRVRPYMQSHGGSVELLEIENDFARLRLEGTCKSCPSSTVTLELAVRRVVEEACPDLAGFEVAGAAASSDAK